MLTGFYFQRVYIVSASSGKSTYGIKSTSQAKEKPNLVEVNLGPSLASLFFSVAERSKLQIQKVSKSISTYKLCQCGSASRISAFLVKKKLIFFNILW